jgi:tetratricopeptide (TPR) repeat protein
MKRICVLLLCTFLAGLVYANDKDVYEQLLDQKKYQQLLVHLQAWERKEPTNPEVYMGYFNYYLAIGRKEGVSLDREAKTDATVIQITDPQTGEVVGYINPATTYDPDSISKAVLQLNQGLEYGEDRLDMYFGKIYILNEVLDYQTAGATLIQVLNRSMENDNKWLWKDNEPLKEGKDFLLSNIQDYYKKWFGEKTNQA